MKNGFVLVDHHADGRTVRAGSVRRDLSDQRFAALEKKGLIREATAAEAGSKKAPAPENKKAPEPSTKKAD